MNRFRASILCLIALISPLPTWAETVSVPSGQHVEFFEVLWDLEGGENVYRFRYIAPDIARNGGKISFDQAEADIQHLCESSALPALVEQGRTADRIVVSLSDKKVEFGKTAPDVTQYFEVYSPEGVTCVWESF